VDFVRGLYFKPFQSNLYLRKVFPYDTRSLEYIDVVVMLFTCIWTLRSWYIGGISGYSEIFLSDYNVLYYIIIL
jgi:hypothetical protein